MTGSCIIDGIDIATLGMFIERGGSDDFLSYPTRRDPDQMDWPDENGLDVDLTDCYFEAKTVKVNYVIIADDERTFKNNLNSFENIHFAAGYRQIYVKEFNKTFSLRFVGFSDFEHKGGLYKQGKKIGKITVEYSMDDPLQIFTDSINSPISYRQNLSQVTLNGFDLSRFGIVVQDIYSTALRPHSAKEALVQKVSSQTGLVADTGDVVKHIKAKMAGRVIEIKCTMLASTIYEFMTNYSALFNQLRVILQVKLGIRTGVVIDCYYMKMSDFKKQSNFSEKVKASFTLILQEL